MFITILNTRLIPPQDALEDIHMDSLPPDWHTYPLIHKKIKSELAGILNTARSEIKRQVFLSYIVQQWATNKAISRFIIQH